MISVSAIDTTHRYTVAGSLLTNVLNTGFPDTYELPISPVNVFLSHIKYLVITGLLSPNSSLNSCFSTSVIAVPRLASSISMASVLLILTSTNDKKVMPIRTGTSCSNRFFINLFKYNLQSLQHYD